MEQGLDIECQGVFLRFSSKTLKKRPGKLPLNDNHHLKEGLSGLH